MFNFTFRRLFWAGSISALALTVGAFVFPQDVGPVPTTADADGALGELLGKADILIDREAGALSIPIQTMVTRELLEYVLVGPNGAAHESLFVTDVQPSLINAALLALGVEQGRNAYMVPVDPMPTEEQRRAGAKHQQVVVPEGDGVFLYVAWLEGDETYFMRVEDALCDLSSQRTMQRHRWVYLGSRFTQMQADQPEVFMADEQGNLINLAFFMKGDTLVTAALPECERQTIWTANDWVLPPRGQPLRLIMAHEKLDRLPAAFAAELPEPDRSLEARSR